MKAGEADGVLFIAIRFVSGGDVGSLLRREGPLPAARVAAIISAVASALDAAHARASCIATSSRPTCSWSRGPASPDHVYLSDFGISKGMQSGALTGSGHFLGTPNYTAPEQITGQSVDGRANQYALACAAHLSCWPGRCRSPTGRAGPRSPRPQIERPDADAYPPPSGSSLRRQRGVRQGHGEGTG